MLQTKINVNQFILLCIVEIKTIAKTRETVKMDAIPTLFSLNSLHPLPHYPFPLTRPHLSSLSPQLLLLSHPTFSQLVTTCKDVPFKYKVKIPSCTFLNIGSYSFLNPHSLTFIKLSNKQAVNVRLIVWYTLFTVIGRDGDRIQQIPCPSGRSSGERPRLPQETRERYVRRYPSKSNL